MKGGHVRRHDRHAEHGNSGHRCRSAPFHRQGLAKGCRLAQEAETNGRRPPVLRSELHRRPQQRRCLPLHGLFRRYLSGQSFRRESRVCGAQRGCPPLVRLHVHSTTLCQSARCAGFDELCVPARYCRHDHRICGVHHARRCRPESDSQPGAPRRCVHQPVRSGASKQLTGLPQQQRQQEFPLLRQRDAETAERVEQPLRTHLPILSLGRLRRRLAPYLLSLPGGLWLLIFFLIPMAVTAFISLESGNILYGYTFDWNLSNYSQGLSEYGPIYIRSLEYGLLATAATLVISYPMAYWIAFRGGRYKSVFLFLLLLPFFVSFVIRTISWQFILADQGMVLGPLKQLHLLPQDFHVLATPFAVIAGLTYNFLPFMALPIYVALDRIDPRLLSAAHDLYANHVQTFLRVVAPLSVPGIFAGFLLTFVPATSDFVNASILGGVNSTMIGNVIETEFLTNNDYPVASALSLVLMAALLVGVLIYARILGTGDVTGVAEL